MIRMVPFFVMFTLLLALILGTMWNKIGTKTKNKVRRNPKSAYIEVIPRQLGG